MRFAVFLRVFTMLTVGLLTLAASSTPTLCVTSGNDAAEPATNGSFTVTRTGSTLGAVTVPVVVGGTATAGADYTALANSVTIPAGQSSVTVAVPVLDDTIVEAAETVTMAIGTVGPVSKLDALCFTTQVTNVVSSGTSHTITLTVTSTCNSRALSHYVFSAPAGQLSTVLSSASNSRGWSMSSVNPDPTTNLVGIKVDGTNLGSGGAVESFTITFTVTGATIPALTVASKAGPDSATVTFSSIEQSTAGYSAAGCLGASINVLSDDLPVVTIVANDPNGAEPNDSGNFRVYRTGPTTAPLSVTVGIGGTATNGVDYLLSSTSTKVVNIAAGRDYVGVVVPVVDDTLCEADETLALTVQPSAAYVVGSPSATTITITSDDLPEVTIVANDPDAGEPNDGGNFRVYRTGPTTGALTVTVAISGTATNGVDYTLSSSSTKVVTIAAGRDYVGVGVPVVDDTLCEADETLVLTVQPGAGFVVGSANQATITITSDDLPEVTIVANDADAGEPDNGGNFRVYRTGPTTGTLTVTVAISGTATNGVDYTLSSSSTKVVTIAAGRDYVGVGVPVVDDNLAEDVETIVLTVQPSVTYVVGAASTATITVTSDDLPEVSIAAVANGAEPSTDGSFVVTRSGALAGPLTVTIELSGSATPGADYEPISVTVVIPAGEASVLIPVEVLGDEEDEAPETVVASVVAGPDYVLGGSDSATVVITSLAGTLWTVGFGGFGTLGDGTVTTRPTPLPIATVGEGTMASNYGPGLFVTVDGGLVVMGRNTFGQLGVGDNADQVEPVELLAGSTTNGVATADTAGAHSMFIKADGSLWGMGYNIYGQLGDGTTTDRWTPVQIVASGVKQVSCGTGHTMFLKTDGSLWGMGLNHQGQLGIGNKVNQSTPVQILSSGVRQVALGGDHSLIVLTSGALYTVGSNANGQLGTGTTVAQLLPALIVPSGVEAADGGGSHSLFKMEDGSLWGMGINEHGGLGDGTTIQRNAPVQIVASDVLRFSAGHRHSLFTLSDRSLWATGFNQYGQLGDGTKVSRLTPVMVQADSVLSISAGAANSMWVRAPETD